MGGFARAGDVVKRRAFVEERRLRRIEILRRHVLIERAAAKGDDAAAPIADRKHDAVAEAVVGHRNIFAGNDEPGFRHVLDRDFRCAEMLLERVLLARRIAEAEFELRRGMQTAVEQIAAAAGAMTRRQRCFEKFRGKLDDVVHRQRHTGLRRQPLDRFREAHPLGQHEKIENIAVLARGEVEPHRLLVIDEERRRFLLVERRQPLPFPPRLAQFHALTHDL